VVILAGAWFRPDDAMIRHGLETTLSRLSADPAWQPKVIVVGSVPIWHKTLPRILASDFLGGDDNPYSRRGLDPEAPRKDKLVASLVGGKATFFSPLAAFCNNNGCLRYVKSGTDIIPFAYDYGHLTEETSVLVAARLAALIDHSYQSNIRPQ